MLFADSAAYFRQRRRVSRQPPWLLLPLAHQSAAWTGPQGYGPRHVEPEMLGELAQLLVQTDELDRFARLPDRGADCRCAVWRRWIGPTSPVAAGAGGRRGWALSMSPQ